MNHRMIAAVALGLALPVTAWAAGTTEPQAAAPAASKAAAPAAADGIRHKSPPDAREYIIWPPDGAVIAGGKFWVRMGLSNMGVAPAGTDVPNTGHHHLIIDADLPPLDEPIPNSFHYRHFGGGQTEARVELPPGKHTLQLLLGDGNHIPFDPPVYSPKITITVP